VSDLVIHARLRLPDDEGMAEVDVHSQLRELLDRNGHDRARLEVWREGEANSPVLTSGKAAPS
jgi:hypothetical protein